MFQSATKLVLELAVISAAIGIAAAWLRRGWPRRSDVRNAAAPALAAVIAVLVVAQLAHAMSNLNHARRAAVSAGAGMESCFNDYGPASRSRLPFINWVKRRIGARAVYALSYSGVPDLPCLTFVLLPALPARPGEHADWTIAFGTVPAAMKVLIARHDQSVAVYAPGFALERNR